MKNKNGDMVEMVEPGNTEIYLLKDPYDRDGKVIRWGKRHRDKQFIELMSIISRIISEKSSSHKSCDQRNKNFDTNPDKRDKYL